MIRSGIVSQEWGCQTFFHPEIAMKETNRSYSGQNLREVPLVQTNKQNW
jgi:hypothetical protein